MRLSVLFLVTFLNLVGCASMEQAYRETYCNYDGAFKLGMNDARDGKPMDTQFGNVCLAEQKSGSQKGYREGYTSFLQSQPAKIIIQKQ